MKCRMVQFIIIVLVWLFFPAPSVIFDSMCEHDTIIGSKSKVTNEKKRDNNNNNKMVEEIWLKKKGWLCVSMVFF